MLLATLLAPVQGANCQTAARITCLTNVQQVRDLDPDEAQKGLPVRLRGVVTYYDASLFNLFMQDATHGIFVLVATNLHPHLNISQQIEVEGVSDKGDYAPIVKAATIRVLGPGHLPAARRVSIDQLFTGLEDSQWVEVSGIVRSTTVLDGRQYLNLAMNGQRVTVYVENFDSSGLSKLINASVRLQGVCYSRYNMKRQLRVPWLAISSLKDVQVEKPSPGPPKEVSIANLAQFNSSGYYGNRVKVYGVVTLQKPDGSLFIQNQNYGLYVQVAQASEFAPGDRVMVLGYSAHGQYVPVLEDATVQLLGHGEPPSPIPTDLKTLLNSPEDFEGVLITLETSLVNLIDNPGRQTLVLQSSNSVFTANLESPQPDGRFKLLKLGSRLALTGIFIAQSPEKWVPGVARSREIPLSNIPYSPPESIQLLSRSCADVTVIHQPPWWTLSRLLWTLGFMTIILLAGLAWVLVLDRRVRQQTRIIQQTVKQAGMLEERNRIAREFHDTLEQELAAINIQLATVEAQFHDSPHVAIRQLELARNMARHSLSEARRSVWDLRSHLLENSNLAAAIKEMVVPLSANTRIAITVQSSGTSEKLPALIEHNLLRIVQEATVNAFKHSRARKIVVSLNYTPRQIQLAVRDDGVGFDPRAVGSPDGGHFGLLNMRERAEKIGARFSLDSGPGNGTEIIITLGRPVLRAPDSSPSEHTPVSASARNECD